MIGLNDSGFSSRYRDPRCDALGLVCRAPAVNRHRVAVAGKALDEPAPDALGTTGDEGNFSHAQPLEM